MRASNYRNYRRAYTPWSHAQMVRAALVEGMALRPGVVPTDEALHETQRYRRLLKKYTHSSLHDRIDHVFDIMQQASLTDRQKGYVRETLRMLDDNNKWVRFGRKGHDKLKHEGVEIPYEGGDIDGLVDMMYHTDETKVVTADVAGLLPDVDLWKHVRPQNRLLMNGGRVIKHFAQAGNIALPADYNGNLNLNVRSVLEQAGYTFNKSFEHCVYVLQENPWILASMLVIKNGRNSETRFFPISVMGGHELYLEVSESTHRNFGHRHGKVEGPFKYRTVTVTVPRRMAFGANNDQDQIVDEITFTHIRHFQDPNRFKLEWEKTRTNDNCHSAHNLLDFEHLRREDYYIGVFDEHARAALEFLAEINDPLLRASGYSLMVYLTGGHQRLIDRLRYNLSDGSGSVGRMNINLLATRVLSKISEREGAHPFWSLYQEGPLPKEDVLKPKLLVRQRKKLE